MQRHDMEEHIVITHSEFSIPDCMLVGRKT
jgi:hypothetical protein